MAETQTVNVGEAKTRLSQLIAAAERGADVVIARNGKPVVKLTPVARRRPQFGFMSHIKIPDSVLFEPMSEEELAEWEDGPVFPDVPVPATVGQPA